MTYQIMESLLYAFLISLLILCVLAQIIYLKKRGYLWGRADFGDASIDKAQTKPTKNPSLPLRIEVNKDFCDRMAKKDVLWCKIRNHTNTTINNIQVELVFNNREYKLNDNLSLLPGEKERVNLMFFTYQYLGHGSGEYANTIIHIESNDPYTLHQYEFEKEYKFIINVYQNDYLPISSAFTLKIQPGSSVQMDYIISQ